MALKIGTEDKKKVAIAVALVVGVLIVALLQLRPYFGGGSASASLPPTVAGSCKTKRPTSCGCGDRARSNEDFRIIGEP
jgi:hypothetical protein